MPIQIQINIQSDDAGHFTDREQAVLSALSGGAVAHTTVINNAGYQDVAADGFPLSDQAEETLEGHKIGTAEVQVEKPKRTRRTKAQIEADRKAEEEGSTGAAVLEDLGDPDPQEDPAAEAQQDAETDAAQVAADLDAEPETVPAEEPKLEATTEPTPADALARASDLVETDAGKALVAKALKEIGVGRVSLIASNEDAAKFLEIVGK